MIDANQAWSPDDAAARIAELAPCRPALDRGADRAPTSRSTPGARWPSAASVPLAAGENVRGLASFDASDRRRLPAIRAARRRQVGRHQRLPRGRPARRGTRRRRSARIGSRGGVGLAASLHLLAAAGTDASFAEVDANPNPLREDVLSARRCDDGVVTLGDAPGLGVEPDLKRLQKYRVAVN